MESACSPIVKLVPRFIPMNLQNIIIPFNQGSELSGKREKVSIIFSSTIFNDFNDGDATTSELALFVLRKMQEKNKGYSFSYDLFDECSFIINIFTRKSTRDSFKSLELHLKKTFSSRIDCSIPSRAILRCGEKKFLDLHNL